jgi:hypothetical protein
MLGRFSASVVTVETRPPTSTGMPAKVVVAIV